MKNKPGNHLVSFFVLAITTIAVGTTGILFAFLIGLLTNDISSQLLRVSFIHSLFMGLGFVVTLLLLNQLLEKIPGVVIVIITFSMILGINLVGFLSALVFEPLIFIYSRNTTMLYITISLVFILSLSVIVTFYMINEKNARRREKILLEEQALRREMELKHYTARINPHFLFNSLNLIVSLLGEPEKAEDALITLSELLRYNVQATDLERVQLEDEIEQVRKYLTVMKMRFPDTLNWSIKGSSSINIPPLLIQPLIENSIKHAKKKINDITITIEIEERDSTTTLTIFDSLSGIEESMMNRGTGLTATRKRVELEGGTFTIREGKVIIGFAK
jgi:two-component system LytT family sensor kinase